jgi:hypothetical protein
MSHIARRLALTAAAALVTTLAACTNPVAPAPASNTSLPAERPSNGGVYMGSGG